MMIDLGFPKRNLLNFAIGGVDFAVHRWSLGILQDGFVSCVPLGVREQRFQPSLVLEKICGNSFIGSIVPGSPAYGQTLDKPWGKKSIKQSFIAGLESKHQINKHQTNKKDLLRYN